MHAALYCVGELIHYRAKMGLPVPQWMQQLSQKLRLTSAMSGSAHEFDSGSAPLAAEPEQSHVGSREAAKLLGLSEAQVRRLASDLDGEKVGRAWVFRLSTVLEYAEERDSGRYR